MSGHPYSDAQVINSELRRLGAGVTNITRTFNTLPEHGYIEILDAVGSSQVRKKYKITQASTAEVEKLKDQRSLFK
jgi:hypothetical protein